MNRLLSAVLLLLLPFIALAQEKFTINGTIRDASNGEALIGVTVFVKEIRNGAVTNAYGFYSITLPAGGYSLDYSYVGFRLESLSIQLDKNIQQNMKS